jgi:hypothetical protein
MTKEMKPTMNKDIEDKIDLLGDLKSILNDPEILKIITAKSTGLKAVEIFKSAIGKEIEAIFTEDSAKLSDPVSNLVDKVKDCTINLERVVGKIITEVESSQSTQQVQIVGNGSRLHYSTPQQAMAVQRQDVNHRAPGVAQEVTESLPPSQIPRATNIFID